MRPEVGPGFPRPAFGLGVDGKGEPAETASDQCLLWLVSRTERHVGLAPSEMKRGIRDDNFDLDAGKLRSEPGEVPGQRSAGRRVGKEWVRTCRSRWWPTHKQKENQKNNL